MSGHPCPKCDRAFVLLSPLVRHVHDIHAPTWSDEARKLPRKTIEEDGQKRVVVPYQEAISGTQGACGGCPKDPARLPGHPNCQCSPSEGWDAYLKAAREDVPENWSKEEWHSYVDTLRKEKV